METAVHSNVIYYPVSGDQQLPGKRYTAARGSALKTAIMQERNCPGYVRGTYVYRIELIDNSELLKPAAL